MEAPGSRSSGSGLGLGIWGCVAGERVAALHEAVLGQGMPPGGVRVWPRPYGWTGDAGRPLRYGLELDSVKAGWVSEVTGGEVVGDVVVEKLAPIPVPAPEPPPPGSTKKPISCLWGDRYGVFEVTLLSPEGDLLVDGDGLAAVEAEVCSAFDPTAGSESL